MALHEALQPSFKEYGAQVVRNAQALAAALTEGGLRIVTGGTDTHLMLADLTATGARRQARADAAGRGADHRQPQRHPARPAPADGHQRHPRLARRP